MRRFLGIFMLIMTSQLCYPHIRNIFEYDSDWRHAEYTILAQGVIHESGKTFKVLQCGQVSKIFESS